MFVQCDCVTFAVFEALLCLRSKSVPGKSTKPAVPPDTPCGAKLGSAPAPTLLRPRHPVAVNLVHSSGALEGTHTPQSSRLGLEKNCHFVRDIEFDVTFRATIPHIFVSYRRESFDAMPT